MALDNTERFFAVHFRHALVHEDDIVAVLKRELDGFLSAGSGIDLDQRVLKKFGGYDKVHPRVVDYEDLGFRRSEALVISLLLAKSLLEFFLEIADRFFRDDLLRYGYGECGTRAVFTLDRNVAVHHFDQHLGDRKA